jgi:hypothetical protein
MGNRLGAVSEFFTRDPFEPDPSILWSLSYVTSRLGMRIAELNQHAMDPSKGKADPPSM